MPTQKTQTEPQPEIDDGKWISLNLFLKLFYVSTNMYIPADQEIITSTTTDPEMEPSSGKIKQVYSKW